MAASAPSSTSPAANDPVPRIKGLYMILPYLYIGDADAACNSAELKRLGIRKILNCASEDVGLNVYRRRRLLVYRVSH